MSLQPTMLIVRLAPSQPPNPETLLTARQRGWFASMSTGLVDFAPDRSINQEGKGVAIAALTEVTYVG